MRQGLFAIAAVLILSLTAHADTVTTFNINGVFQGGGAALSGTLVFDNTTSQFISTNIQTGRQEGFLKFNVGNQANPGGDFLVSLIDAPGAGLFQELDL